MSVLKYDVDIFLYTGTGNEGNETRKLGIGKEQGSYENVAHGVGDSGKYYI